MTSQLVGSEERDALALADGHQLPLLGTDLYVGRAQTNHIVIDDPTIVNRHARLQRFPDGWVLSDLAGSDRTAVNGQRLTRPVVLAPGDTIRLGDLVVVFQCDGSGPRHGGRSVALGHEERGAVGDEAVPTRRVARPPGGAPLIALHNVVKTYQASAGPLTVLRGVSLAIQAGEFVAIAGPSGCGKSTLLNVITGIDRPDAGEVIIGGQNIHRLSSYALTAWRGRTVGIVFQFFQLLPTLTVVENVMLPMAFCNTYRGRQRRARALDVLRRVGMEHLADRLPSVLSGGEQQRVAIARALANNPPVLVADEPTGNLDTRTGAQIFDVFAQLVAGGTTVLMVTHDPVLAGKVRRRVEMLDGAIVAVS
jgi:putative ABC transport system ATP-binding protein